MAPAAPLDEPDRCLRCHRQAPGAHYPFFVALRQSPSGRILHEERPFLCDRCARARMRFAPLVVLLFWVPMLTLATLFTWRKLWLSLPLLSVIVVLIRLACGQLRAIRHGLYRHPPYSGTVARLAIELRQKDVLRSLHRVAPEVMFLTEADRGAGSADTAASGRAEGAGRFEINPR